MFLVRRMTLLTKGRSHFFTIRVGFKWAAELVERSWDKGSHVYRKRRESRSGWNGQVRDRRIHWFTDRCRFYIRQRRSFYSAGRILLFNFAEAVVSVVKCATVVNLPGNPCPCIRPGDPSPCMRSKRQSIFLWGCQQFVKDPLLYLGDSMFGRSNQKLC